jgi:hypothetical protein
MSTPDIVFVAVSAVVAWTALAFFLGRRYERRRVAEYLLVVERNTANSEYHTKAASSFIGALSYCVANKIYAIRPRFSDEHL